MSTVPVSVVIPAFNAEKFIQEAIESVFEQTLSVAEIIVVDNNSTDQTKEIAGNLGVKVIEERKPGPAAARNRGMQFCNNPWIAFLDADDCWNKRKIEYQWEAAKKYPNAGMISCKLFVFKEKTAIETFNGSFEEIESSMDEACKYFSKVTLSDFLEHCGLPSGVIINREVISTIGFFDERFLYHQDAEYFSRILAQYPLAIINKPLMNYRLHENNRSKRKEERFLTMKQIVEKMMRFPENYLPGASEHYLKTLKRAFIEKGHRLAREQREATI